MKNKKSAFTLIELLVVIAIIGILATIAVVALQNARAKARDARRVADVKQTQTALELFFNDKGRYPSSAEFNSGSLSSTSTQGTTTYMAIIPTPPSPADGSCVSTSSSAYNYSASSDGTSYSMSYCLGGNTGSITPGVHCATPVGIADGANCTITVAPQYPSGLVHYWSADGNANDSIGTYNGTLLGGATFAPGKIGQAFSFDGLGGRVDIGSNLNFNAEDFSIGLWMKTNATNARRGIFSKLSGTTKYYLLELNGAYLRLCLGPVNSGEVCVSSATPIDTSNWYYAMTTYNQNNGTIKMYVNGIETGSQSVASGFVLSWPISTLISDNENGYVSYFSGLMDNVQVYSRALSAGEVLTIYNSAN